MKKPIAVAAALSIALLCAACTGGSKGGQDGGDVPSESPAGPLADVQWIDGDPPSLEFSKPYDLGTDYASRVVKEGDGAAVEPGTVVQLNFTVVGGEDGTVFGSTYQDDGSPLAYQMEETDPGDTIWRAINGQKVGADVLVAYTETPQAEDLSASPSEPASHDPVYFVALTIVGVQTVLERAEGEAFVPDTPGIPTVTLDAAGEPSIEIPAGVDPPAALVSEILIKGSGPEVQADQSVTANYSGWLWDGTLFDSSWGRGSPSTFSLAGGVIDGWTEGLAGVPVGSQVLLVIPPDLGYGASGQGDIPGGATLVFVVDVLGAV